MKLLFDQNISFRIIGKLDDYFDEVNQVKFLNLVDSSDIDIWQFAKINGYTIVSFDSDFADLSFIKGTPPKIIWLRFRNQTTANISNQIIKNREIISAFLTSNEFEGIACLEIH